jgi:hypothetical protein
LFHFRVVREYILSVLQDIMVLQANTEWRGFGLDCS